MVGKDLVGHVLIFKMYLYVKFISYTVFPCIFNEYIESL